jgi:cell migration-inducing and hyaluronan-binding protein
LLHRLAIPAATIVAIALCATLTVVLAPADAGAATVQRWSEGSTWGGPLPAAGEVVTIPAGKTVVLDVSPPKLGGLQINGTLRFADRALRLHSAWIMVHGRLQVGTPSQPFSKPATIVLDGKPTDNPMGMGSSALAVMGGVLDLHGARRPVSWTRLQTIAVAGSRTIRVQSAQGWRAGDRIVIASTDLDPARAEERKVASVNGNAVTLTSPLANNHWGRSDEIGGKVITQRAEVGLLSRNIVIRGGASAATTSLGGHVMVHAGSTARVDNVEMVHMGQAGRLARYPFHFHMMGSAPDSYIRSSVIHHSFNRCITVHGTSDVTVADNVGYAARGHCFFFEDGVERRVRLLRNLGLSTLRPAPDKRLLDSDDVPATFWIQHPDNIVRGNAAAGSDGNGFWYDIPQHPTGLSATQSISGRTAPMGVFAGNVAHSNINRAGRWRSGTGLLIEDYHPSARALFSGLQAYKNSGFGVWAEHNVAVAGAKLSDNNVGFLGRDAILRDSHVVGATSNVAEKHWSMIGAGFYHDAMGVHRVSFANFKPDEWRHGVALGSVVEHINTLPRISGVRFANADRVRLTPPWMSDRISAAGFRDLDGSVTGSGKPSTVVTGHPLMRVRGCTANARVKGYVCPAGGRYTYVMAQDQSGASAALGPTRVVRDDGVSYAASSDPGHAWRPQSETTVPLGRRYRFEFGRQTPTNLEWVVANSETGWVQLATAWPHSSVHVYEGWGPWARTLRPASSQAELAEGGRYWLDPSTQRLHVRFRNGGTWSWQRMKVCTARYCGEGLGTQTS